MEFKVIDLQTGEEADTKQIALTEEWAKGLIYCDIEEFAIGEDDTLYLLDEIGQWIYCPANRFKVIITNKGGEKKKMSILDRIIDFVSQYDHADFDEEEIFKARSELASLRDRLKDSEEDAERLADAAKIAINNAKGLDLRPLIIAFAQHQGMVKK